MKQWAWLEAGRWPGEDQWTNQHSWHFVGVVSLLLHPRPPPQHSHPRQGLNTSQEGDRETSDIGFTAVRGGVWLARLPINPTNCLTGLLFWRRRTGNKALSSLKILWFARRWLSFVGVPRRWRNYCYTGAGIDGTKAALGYIFAVDCNEYFSVLHANTKNITNTCSEDLLDKYWRLIQHNRTKSPNIIYQEILQRLQTYSIIRPY